MMKDEEAYVLHTSTNPELFAAEFMRLQPNTDLFNSLLGKRPEAFGELFLIVVYYIADM